jgi:hypothetical protein
MYHTFMWAAHSQKCHGMTYGEWVGPVYHWNELIELQSSSACLPGLCYLWECPRAWVVKETGLPNLKSESLTLATWSLIWSHRVSEGKGLPATATGLILTDHRSWQLTPFPAPSLHKNRILLIFFWHGAPTGVQCHHVYSSRTYGHACVTR